MFKCVTLYYGTLQCITVGYFRMYITVYYGVLQYITVDYITR